MRGSAAWDIMSVKLLAPSLNPCLQVVAEQLLRALRLPDQHLGAALGVRAGVAIGCAPACDNSKQQPIQMCCSFARQVPKNVSFLQFFCSTPDWPAHLRELCLARCARAAACTCRRASSARRRSSSGSISSSHGLTVSFSSGSAAYT